MTQSVPPTGGGLRVEVRPGTLPAIVSKTYSTRTTRWPLTRIDVGRSAVTVAGTACPWT